MKKIIESAARKTDKFKPKDRIVAIEIKDTGAGMDDETLKRVFEPFFSTKKGAGLGLFICYGIINNHGAHIVAQSQLGGGSTFIVKLPVVSRERRTAMKKIFMSPSHGEAYMRYVRKSF